MSDTPPTREAIEDAARRFGLRIPPQDVQRGIDPQMDAIEDAAKRFGLQLPPRHLRRNVEPASVLNTIWPGRTS